MRLPGSRTLRRIRLKSKSAAFRALGMQEYLDAREAEELALAMGFVGQFDEHRRFQFEFLKQQGLDPSSKVLEIGFGPLTLGIPLIEYLEPGGYTGVDVRPSVANLAYSQLKKHRLASKNPRLIVADDFGRRDLEGAKFDIIWAFSVLFHLTDDLADQMFGTIPSLLSPQGRFFGLINASMDESTWREFPFVKRGPGFYEELGHRHGLVMKELGAISELGFRRETEEKRHILLEFVRA